MFSHDHRSVKTATKEEELEDWQMKLERERSRTSDNGNLPAATPLIDVDNVSAVLANDIADQQGEIISLDKASEEVPNILEGPADRPPFIHQIIVAFQALPIPQRLRSDYEELEEALPESSFENLVKQTILINEPPSSAGLRDPLEGAVAEFDFKPSNVGPHPILPSYAPYGRPLSSDSSFGVSVTPITVDSVIQYFSSSAERVNCKLQIAKLVVKVSILLHTRGQSDFDLTYMHQKTEHCTALVKFRFKVQVLNILFSFHPEWHKAGGGEQRSIYQAEGED
jgi:hypothetical protein